MARFIFTRGTARSARVPAGAACTKDSFLSIFGGKKGLLSSSVGRGSYVGLFPETQVLPVWNTDEFWGAS